MPLNSSNFTIVVLTFNSESWIDPLVESLLLTTPPAATNVIFIDNQSTDGTREKLLKYQGKIKLIFNDRNLGFAAGCNVGIRNALSDGSEFIALLNPDIRVSPDWLNNLIKGIQKRGPEGIFTPIQLKYDGSGIDPEMRKGILFECEEFADDLWNGQLNTTYPLSCAYFGSVVIHRSVFERIGLLDECFFMYGEDEDFCRRAKRNGFPIWLVPKSKVFHWHTQAQTEAGKVISTIGPHIRRSRFLLTLKDLDRSWPSRCLSVLKTLVGNTIHNIFFARWEELIETVKDGRWVLNNLQRIRNSRENDIRIEKGLAGKQS
ncbi:glycosyltransferase family 2 protein [Thermodesulfobacteriota bacterium]